MLRLPPVTVAQPTSLSEAIECLGGEQPLRVLAGGTDLLVALKQGHRRDAGRALGLLSLAKLPLSGIASLDGKWQIGATTTLRDLARWKPSEDHRPLQVVAQVAREIAAPPIQSRATLGGNLCLDTRCIFYNQSSFWRSGRPACLKAGGEVCHAVPGTSRCHACHQADLAPLMIALGASAKLESTAGKREVEVESLYSGIGMAPLTLRPSEILTEVLLPVPPTASGAGWEKVRVRKGLDFAVASAAAYVEAEEDGTCSRARIVLGACGTSPIRVHGAEEALRGTKLETEVLEEAAECARKAGQPAKNAELTPAYRRRVLGTAVKRAALRAWNMATGGHN